MDSLANAWRWKRWTATGPAEAIARLLTNLDANLPTGWRRLAGDELRPFGVLVRPGSSWYDLVPDPSRERFALSIQRPVPEQLRGGWVWSHEWECFADSINRPAEKDVIRRADAAWDQVGLLLDDGIVPAARTAGVNIRVPPPEEMFLSELPFEVGDRLRRFSDADRKSLPLDPKEAELWRDFVVAVFRTKAIIDTEPFVNWLAAVGWPRESAAEMYSQLVDDCLLLSRYADEVSAA
jgi:hypothetical protein